MRRNYAVIYDISDDKRRTRVFKTLYGFGNHAQYSVFFCELNERELVRLRSILRAEINHHEDQVIFVDIGTSNHSLEASLEVLGKPYDPPTPTMII